MTEAPRTEETGMPKKIIFAIFAVLMSYSAVASADPFAGNWRMSVAPSKYPAGTCPTSMVIEIGPAGQGSPHRAGSRFMNGSEMHAQYTADYDGKQVIVM